ncbi:MAG: ATP-binding protein [Crocinitomicaceae bacterium]|nr:ATP-binding protein [Crocinitomicaceae bacterium]MBK8926079.1 ATP-binding protein [Crocinitomicaceae bacterium]
MVLKQEIENAYVFQQQEILKDIGATSRQYLGKFGKGGNHVEVISGIRRCGKSTLMKQLMAKHKKNIAYFNFEDPRVFGFDVKDFQKLDEIMGRGKSAYFFDEIQNVPRWEIFIRQLHDRGEKVYITGSNASLLSKELGTRLTGRHLHHELFPFSYSEFLIHKKLKNTTASFEKYIEHGGFPEYLRDYNQEMLQTLLKDIVLRDIAIRYAIRNNKTLMDMTLFLISNIAKETTFNSLRRTFSVGSTNSVVGYLAWLEDSYLLFFLPRFSYSAKSVSVNPRKVYAIDSGLINANSLSFSKDKGRLLENTVYLYLRQKYQQLYYFREKTECDFVVMDKNKCIHTIQVCEELNSDNLDRELAGLTEAAHFFKMKKAYILTKNQSETFVHEKVTVHVIAGKDILLL